MRPTGPVGRLSEHPLPRVAGMLELNPLRVAGVVAVGALALGSGLALIAVSAWLVARASQQPAVVEVSLAVVAVRALGIGRGVFRYLERLTSHDLALSGLVSLRERCYSVLAGARPQVVAGLRRGDLLTRLGADVDAVGDTVVRGALPFAVAAVVGAGAVLATAVVLPLGALFLLAGLLVSGVFAPWLSARAARAAQVGAALARARVSEETMALVDGLAELEVAGAIPARRVALAQAEDDLAAALEAAARLAAGASAVQALATGATVVSAVLVGSEPVASGTLAPVWLPVLVLLSLAAFEVTAMLPAAAVELVRGTQSAGRLLDLLDDARVGPAPAAGSVVPGAGPHRLRARGLTCGWTRDNPVVSDLVLDLAPGRTLAVLGASGSGKTTLLLTLAGLLPPLEGTLTLDGTNLSEFEPSGLRSVVSCTTEDAHVFATTVRENLRVAAGAVDDTALLEALGAVGLGAWASGLPHGLATVLGSGGRDISGGQRRRLLLARALLTGAGVLLLDEAQEHLESQSARALVEDLHLVVRRTGCSLVLATHSDSVIEGFDEVLHLDRKGRAP